MQVEGDGERERMREGDVERGRRSEEGSGRTG